LLCLHNKNAVFQAYIRGVVLVTATLLVLHTYSIAPLAGATRVVLFGSQSYCTMWVLLYLHHL